MSRKKILLLQKLWFDDLENRDHSGIISADSSVGTIMETYEFTCSRCGSTFQKEGSLPPERWNLLAVVLTLGLWLPIWAVWQWWQIFNLSRCPECNRRSRRVLVPFLVLLLVTTDVLGSYFYLSMIVPDRIAERTASAEPLGRRENALLYLSVLTPQFGPFVLIGWFLIFSVVLLMLPNRY